MWDIFWVKIKTIALLYYKIKLWIKLIFLKKISIFQVITQNIMIPYLYTYNSKKTNLFCYWNFPNLPRGYTHCKCIFASLPFSVYLLIPIYSVTLHIRSTQLARQACHHGGFFFTWPVIKGKTRNFLATLSMLKLEVLETVFMDFDLLCSCPACEIHHTC